MIPCQVADATRTFPCAYRDSGGAQCERLDVPHTEHRYSQHTVNHELAGNGYACSSIEGSWDV